MEPIENKLTPLSDADDRMGERDETAKEVQSAEELMERARGIGFSCSELDKLRKLYGAELDQIVPE